MAKNRVASEAHHLQFSGMRRSNSPLRRTRPDFKKTVWSNGRDGQFEDFEMGSPARFTLTHYMARREGKSINHWCPQLCSSHFLMVRQGRQQFFWPHASFHVLTTRNCTLRATSISWTKLSGRTIFSRIDGLLRPELHNARP